MKVFLQLKKFSCCLIRSSNVHFSINQTEQIVVPRINEPFREPRVIVPFTNEQVGSDILTESLTRNEQLGNVITSHSQEGIQKWLSLTDMLL